jgi:hemoglobin-like flavoprotein
MTIQDYLTLSPNEIDLILRSVQKLKGKTQQLVERFYFHFLNSNEEISRLFDNTEMLKQHNMFNVSLGVIISNINEPILLQQNLNELIKRHALYGVLPHHIRFFTESYTKAFIEVFGNTDPVMKIWLKVIHSTMEYFKSQL